MAGNIRSIGSGSPRPHIDDNSFIYYTSGYSFSINLYTLKSNPCRLPTKIGLKIVHKNQSGTNFPQYLYDYDEVIIPVQDARTVLNVHYWHMSKKWDGSSMNNITEWSEGTDSIEFYANKIIVTLANGKEYYNVYAGLSKINGESYGLFSNSNDWKVDYQFFY